VAAGSTGRRCWSAASPRTARGSSCMTGGRADPSSCREGRIHLGDQAGSRRHHRHAPPASRRRHPPARLRDARRRHRDRRQRGEGRPGGPGGRRPDAPPRARRRKARLPGGRQGLPIGGEVCLTGYFHDAEQKGTRESIAAIRGGDLIAPEIVEKASLDDMRSCVSSLGNIVMEYLVSPQLGFFIVQAAGGLPQVAGLPGGKIAGSG